MQTTNLNFEPIDYSDKSKSILDNINKTLGFVPNMYYGMAHNTALLDIYTYGSESFKRNSGFSQIEQEVIFLTASYLNNCEYCMAAHSFISDNFTKVPEEITNALRMGESLSDSKLNALSSFTKTMLEKRGNVSDAELEIFFNAGYSEKHILGVIAGLALKTISNYTGHFTQSKLDNVFIGRKWRKN